MIRATLVYVFVAVYVLVLGPIAIVWIWLARDARFAYAAARLCVRIAGLLCGVRVRVRGREKLRPDCNYFFLSNHQGNFDAPVLLYAIPGDVRAVIKQEMMRIPVLSLLMRQVGFVPIDRTDPKRARLQIERAVTLLRGGYSFIAFPEGTRTRDGRLGPFKRGVFAMALAAGAPVVPVTILHSRAIQPPGRYGIRPGVIELVFHDPIPTERTPSEGRERLMELTRAAIASALEEEESAPIREI